MTHKISFKLLDKYNLCGIIKNVENRWIDDSSRQIMLKNDNDNPSTANRWVISLYGRF